MAGAVGSSSMAGMAARVNNDVRARAAIRSGEISQHDGILANCGEELIRDRKLNKILRRENATHVWEEKKKRRDLRLPS